MSDENKTTPADVARWMLEEFERRGELCQDEAAAAIDKQFGRGFLRKNADGGVSISKAVLREFRKLHKGAAVWDPSDWFWRRWEPGDPPVKRED